MAIIIPFCNVIKIDYLYSLLLAIFQRMCQIAKKRLLLCKLILKGFDVYRIDYGKRVQPLSEGVNLPSNL